MSKDDGVQGCKSVGCKCPLLPSQGDEGVATMSGGGGSVFGLGKGSISEDEHLLALAAVSFTESLQAH